MVRVCLVSYLGTHQNHEYLLHVVWDDGAIVTDEASSNLFLGGYP